MSKKRVDAEIEHVEIFEAESQMALSNETNNVKLSAQEMTKSKLLQQIEVL